tara:strand:+ start:110 stop:757 length:648 start_codon:yes stop_codon:yes gene_type:complete
MNPIDVAWLVLKAPTEGYDPNLTDEENTDGRHTGRQPQQPTITDFMGYTRPQLEQMLIMFQNELVRRGHTSGGGNEYDNVTVSPDIFDTYQTGESRAMREEEPDRLRHLDTEENLTETGLATRPARPARPGPAAAARRRWEEQRRGELLPVASDYPDDDPDANESARIQIDNAMSQADITSQITPDHIRIYRQFEEMYGRPPSIEEIIAHMNEGL